MIARLLFTLALVLVAPARAAEPAWLPDAKLVATVDALAKIHMPARWYDAKSWPIDKYGRYYAGDYYQGQRIVRGEFILIEGFAESDYQRGVHIVPLSKLPGIMDGGCSVITLRYFIDTKKLAIGCNGFA